MKVLAIDDDRDFLNLLEVYLKKVGYTTTPILDAEGILHRYYPGNLRSCAGGLDDAGRGRNHGHQGHSQPGQANRE